VQICFSSIVPNRLVYQQYFRLAYKRHMVQILTEPHLLRLTLSLLSPHPLKNTWTVSSLGHNPSFQCIIYQSLYNSISIVRVTDKVLKNVCVPCLYMCTHAHFKIAFCPYNICIMTNSISYRFIDLVWIDGMYNEWMSDLLRTKGTAYVAHTTHIGCAQ
jgi:hypothetical protein